MLRDFSFWDVDEQHPVVQVLDREGSARQSREQVELNVSNQVVSFTFEPIVRSLLDDNDNISRLCARRLIAFATELHCLTSLHPLVDVYLQKLLLGKHLLALALSTSILRVDDLARA
jgi:hypothetical protein